MHFKINFIHLHSQSSDGAIAQSVEQKTENPCVPGSIPGGTTIKNPWKIFRDFFITKDLIKKISYSNFPKQNILILSRVQKKKNNDLFFGSIQEFHPRQTICCICQSLKRSTNRFTSNNSFTWNSNKEIAFIDQIANHPKRWYF